MSTTTTATTSIQDQNEKKLSMEMLRDALPACQPQEGSPANTFTESEKEQLQSIFPNMKIGARNSTEQQSKANRIDICNPDWSNPEYKKQQTQELHDTAQEALWHGAPRMDKAEAPRAFRESVRNGTFQGPTNGVCPGFLQCNLVVLPQGPHAFDFLLFCQRNPKACPLIEVCDVGSPYPNGVAKGADLRTDVPMYAIYRDGKLEKEVSDVTEYWPENSVAFLIGCSFSYDGALLDAHIPLRRYVRLRRLRCVVSYLLLTYSNSFVLSRFTVPNKV